MNRIADIDIPKALWSNWIPSVGKREIKRALTPDERTALEKRRDELAPWVAGFEGREEGNRVAAALAQMFSSFRSMRSLESNAVAQIEFARRSLVDFPVWAIVSACDSIARNGVWRDGAYDRQWPPNDSEIVAEVRDKLRLYGDQYRSAVDLLNAEVER